METDYLGADPGSDMNLPYIIPGRLLECSLPGLLVNKNV